jgi:hypothetical protein
VGVWTSSAPSFTLAVYVRVVKQMPGCSYADERAARREHAIKQ